MLTEEQRRILKLLVEIFSHNELLLLSRDILNCDNQSERLDDLYSLVDREMEDQLGDAQDFTRELLMAYLLLMVESDSCQDVVAAVKKDILTGEF